MDEVFEYSKKSKLACHVIGKKVLFLNGSSRVVCIHHTTSSHTIKELVKKGFRIFERGDTNTKETEIKYFIRMAENVLDERVLPVIISLRNGGLNKDVLFSASSLLLPIIRFKKNSPDATVLTLENDGSTEHATEHITNLKTPWTVRKSETLIVIKNAETAEEISAINDVKSNLDFGALICHVIIGVFMANKQKVYETDQEVYANVLSMYLLKIEKWKIPEDAIKMAFDYRSIEYIYEKDLATAFASGLRTDLEALSRLTDLPNDWKEKDIERAIANSDVIGLIFLTLLRKQFYSGATQLIDTGFVRIRHILIGCKILQDASDDKKNEQIQRETSQRLKIYFTERATLITGFIYEATLNNDLVENELDEAVNHAGRLLVNHGYLEDAIRTENKAFLENKIVTDILHKMWYGEEKSFFRQVGLFILLALLHLLVMPVLMINTTTPPLKWFYKKYNLPFMKALIQMLGYLALLMTYAYMLLFDLHYKFSWTDTLIIGWMISFFLNEIKQTLVSAIRHRFKRYMCNVWNLLDWTVMCVYASGMFLKFEDDVTYKDSTKILLVLTFILLSIRILNMFSISEYLGPKLVIIQKMFKDTFVFLVILTVIMVSYNVSYHSLLYPNSELSWKEIEKVMQNGYWTLFGEVGLIDSETLADCTDNKTIFNNNDDELRKDRCPTELGLRISPYLKAIYGLIAVILLLNLLIAIYSDTYKKVNDECKFHWSQIQTDFLEEYSIETIFPIHLKLLMLPFGIVHVLVWLTQYCCFKIKDRRLNKIEHEDQHDSLNSYDSERDKWKENPMFVRVFLYNADYDLKLKSTEEAERIGAARKIEITEEDKITKLQNQMDVMNRELKDQHKRSDEMLKTMKEDMLKTIKNEMLKINHDNLKEIKSMIKAQFKHNSEQEGQPASTQLYDSSFEFKDDFKTETSNISPGETSTTGGFDDILQARPVTEEQDYYTYDLISTEIQDKPRVQGYLSHFVTFAGERITDRYAGEKIKQQSRVVKTSWTPKEDMQLGTIVKVKRSGKEVYVQWDKIEEKVNLLDLRLVTATENSSRVVLMSRTIIPSSTVSDMQVGKNVNLRLLDNAPISTIVKVNIMLQTARVRWDKQPEEKVQLYKLRVIGNYLTGDICACGSSGSYRGHPGRCDSKVLCLEDKGRMFPRGIACSNGECRNSITGQCSSNCSAEVCQQEVPIGMSNGVKFIQFILF
ncbi:TRPM2 [Mytilus edulis]|uniref:TRPM2 n=1 Tax=Mytilus edulis TaxID=6550 RepID=A0A8S3VML4_MYTED|nr:TRPM2 [Mytilus edulis]